MFMKLSSVEKHCGAEVGTGAQGQDGCEFYSSMMILCGFCMCVWVLSGFSSYLTQSKYSTCQLATLYVYVSITSSTCFSLSLFLCCRWSSNTGTWKCLILFFQSCSKEIFLKSCWAPKVCLFSDVFGTWQQPLQNATRDVIMGIIFFPVLLSFNPDLPSVLRLNRNTWAIWTSMRASLLYWSLTVVQSVMYSMKYLFLHWWCTQFLIHS